MRRAGRTRKRKYAEPLPPTPIPAKARRSGGKQQLLPPRSAAPCAARRAGDAGLLASASAAGHPAGPGTADRGESQWPSRGGLSFAPFYMQFG